MGTSNPGYYTLGISIMVCFVIIVSVFSILILIEEFIDRFSHEESTPTGATKVLYKNDLDIVLEVQKGGTWTDIRNIDTLSGIFNYPNKYRVTKDGVVVEVPDVAYTAYIEKSGVNIYQDYRRLAKIRIDSITLVEMEDVTTLQIGKRISKCIGRHRYNKVVINYEVTNVAEVEQGITEDKQRKQSKDQTKELLQQFVVPTKGE